MLNPAQPPSGKANFCLWALALFWILGVGIFANHFWLNWVLKFPQKEQIEILRVIWLPLLALGSSIPFALLFSSQMGKLYELKQSLDNAPDRLSAAITKAEEFEDAIRKVSADAQNTLADLSDKFRLNVETSAQQILVSIPIAQLPNDHENPLDHDIDAARAVEEVTENEAERNQELESLDLRKQILAHVEPAAEGLYGKIDSWNGDGRRLRTGELIVSKSGGNRADIAALLAEKNLISAFQQDYWSRAFQLELQTRRRRPTIDEVKGLVDLANKV